MPYLQVAVGGSPIPMRQLDAGLTIVSLIASEAEVAGWNTEGLPHDPVSSENGAIVTSSKRWPLIIDPQLQGIKWIKNKYAENLTVLRLGKKGYLDTIETLVCFNMVCFFLNIRRLRLQCR